VQAIAVSPGYAEDGIGFVTLSAPKNSAALRSTDGGVTFRRLVRGLDNASNLTDIALSPRFGTDGIVFITSEEDGLFRSMDGGDSFARIGTLPAPASRRRSGRPRPMRLLPQVPDRLGVSSCSLSRREPDRSWSRRTERPYRRACEPGRDRARNPMPREATPRWRRCGPSSGANVARGGSTISLPGPRGGAA